MGAFVLGGCVVWPGGCHGVMVSPVGSHSRQSSCPWSRPGQSSTMPQQVQCPVALRPPPPPPGRTVPTATRHELLSSWPHGPAPIGTAVAAGASPSLPSGTPSNAGVDARLPTPHVPHGRIRGCRAVHSHTAAQLGCPRVKADHTICPHSSCVQPQLALSHTRDFGVEKGHVASWPGGRGDGPLGLPGNYFVPLISACSRVSAAQWSNALHGTLPRR